jgi:hypothetical protein
MSRRLQSFIAKYGEIEGRARVRYIAKVAAQARWKAFYKGRI